MSSRFEGALRQLAEKLACLREKTIISQEKDLVLVELMDTRLSAEKPHLGTGKK